MTLWAFETLLEKKKSEKITIFFSLRPESENAGAQRKLSSLHSCTFVQLERPIVSGWCHLAESEALLTSDGSPETVFNNSDYNKMMIFTRMFLRRESSEDGGRFTSSDCTSRVLNSPFVSLEEADKETKYEFMALAVRQTPCAAKVEQASLHPHRS